MTKSTKRIALLLLLALLCAAVSGCGTANSNGKGVLSNFSTTDLDGNTLDQSVLTNAKLTMVNVWATFCSPCLAEMPDLALLADELAADGVQVIGLVSDVLQTGGTLNPDAVALAREIVNKTGANYLHIIPSEDLYNLLNQITSVPTTFFVDANGIQVGNVYLGARDHDEWAQIIAETLALLP